jgi:hypothetical protein
LTDYSDFVAQIKEYQNRQDWSDLLVQGFVRMSEQKFNEELRISWMIQTEDGLVTGRCADLPADWLEMSLVRISNPSVPTGFYPIHYKARDEFFKLPDKWSRGFYTIEGRELFVGGPPDTTNGRTLRISYYGKVPVFSDAQPSWIYTEYPSLFLAAASMQAFMHAVGEEQNAGAAKQLTEDTIQKLNAEWAYAKASGSRLTRTRTRSFG